MLQVVEKAPSSSEEDESSDEEVCRCSVATFLEEKEVEKGATDGDGLIAARRKAANQLHSREATLA